MPQFFMFQLAAIWKLESGDLYLIETKKKSTAQLIKNYIKKKRKEKRERERSFDIGLETKRVPQLFPFFVFLSLFSPHPLFFFFFSHCKIN